jgi:hypothetical protein
MGGMVASTNCTSTAGPAIWITCPIFSAINKVQSGRLKLPINSDPSGAAEAAPLQNKRQTKIKQRQNKAKPK